jgi:hypothetical protein
MERSAFLPAVVLALGLILAATVFGVFFYQAREARDTVQTVGAATTEFTADVAKWRLTLTRRTGLGSQQAGYVGLAEDVAGLRAQLRDLGLPDTAVTVQPPSAHEFYENGRVSGYQVQQTLFVVGKDVAEVESLALAPAGLRLGGASLQMSQLEYFYSGLDRLKRSLLAQAAADARERAAEIAAGAEVGHLISARAGVFQITEPLSTEVASYGMHATATRRQEITVTVHATFALDG